MKCFLAGALVGAAILTGGCGQTDPKADPASFRKEVREQLVEEYGDVYAECMRGDPDPSRFWDDDLPRLKRYCRRRAEAILP